MTPRYRTEFCAPETARGTRPRTVESGAARVGYGYGGHCPRWDAAEVPDGGETPYSAPRSVPATAGTGGATPRPRSPTGLRAKGSPLFDPGLVHGACGLGADTGHSGSTWTHLARQHGCSTSAAQRLFANWWTSMQHWLLSAVFSVWAGGWWRVPAMLCRRGAKMAEWRAKLRVFSAWSHIIAEAISLGCSTVTEYAQSLDHSAAFAKLKANEVVNFLDAEVRPHHPGTSPFVVGRLASKDSVVEYAVRSDAAEWRARDAEARAKAAEQMLHEAQNRAQRMERRAQEAERRAETVLSERTTALKAAEASTVAAQCASLGKRFSELESEMQRRDGLFRESWEASLAKRTSAAQNAEATEAAECAALRTHAWTLRVEHSVLEERLAEKTAAFHSMEKAEAAMCARLSENSGVVEAALQSSAAGARHCEAVLLERLEASRRAEMEAVDESSALAEQVAVAQRAGVAAGEHSAALVGYLAAAQNAEATEAARCATLLRLSQRLELELHKAEDSTREALESLNAERVAAAHGAEEAEAAHHAALLGQHELWDAAESAMLLSESALLSELAQGSEQVEALLGAERRAERRAREAEERAAAAEAAEGRADRIAAELAARAAADVEALQREAAAAVAEAEDHARLALAEGRAAQRLEAAVPLARRVTAAACGRAASGLERLQASCCLASWRRIAAAEVAERRHEEALAAVRAAEAEARTPEDASPTPPPRAAGRGPEERALAQAVAQLAEQRVLAEESLLRRPALTDAEVQCSGLAERLQAEERRAEEAAAKAAAEALRCEGQAAELRRREEEGAAELQRRDAEHLELSCALWRATQATEEARQAEAAQLSAHAALAEKCLLLEVSEATTRLALAERGRALEAEQLRCQVLEEAAAQREAQQMAQLLALGEAQRLAQAEAEAQAEALRQARWQAELQAQREAEREAQREAQHEAANDATQAPPAVEAAKPEHEEAMRRLAEEGVRQRRLAWVERRSEGLTAVAEVRVARLTFMVWRQSRVAGQLSQRVASAEVRWWCLFAWRCAVRLAQGEQLQDEYPGSATRRRPTPTGAAAKRPGADRRGQVMTDAFVSSQAALREADAWDAEQERQGELLAGLAFDAKRRNGLGGARQAASPQPTARGPPAKTGQAARRWQETWEQEMVEHRALMQRCFKQWHFAHVQVELAAQMRQLAAWAAEGLKLLARVAFRAWRHKPSKGQKLQVLGAACGLLARRLDAVCAQVLLVSWRAACSSQAAQSSPAAASEQCQAQGRTAGFQPRFAGRLALFTGEGVARPFRGPAAAELLGGVPSATAAVAAAAAARPSAWRRALRRAEAAVRLLERTWHRRRAFVAWALAARAGEGQEEDHVADRGTAAAQPAFALQRRAFKAWVQAAAMSVLAALEVARRRTLRAVVTAWRRSLSGGT